MSTGTEMSRFGGLPRRGRGAPGQDHLSDCAHGPPGHRQPLGHRGRAYTVSGARSSTARMSSSFAGGPKPGVLLPLRGSSSCVTRDPAASDSAQPAPKRARIAVRAVFGLEHDSGGLRSGATRSARDSPSRILTASPVATEFPARGSGEDRIGRIVAHEGEALDRGPGDGVRRVEHPAARRSCGGPETGGSEGARPPASLRRGRTQCGHKEYAGLFPIIMQIPA